MDNNVTTPDIMDALIPQAQPLPYDPQSPGQRIDYANRLHTECARSVQQMQAIGVRMWQMAVVIGYQLDCLKAELPHGEYGKLFKSGKLSSWAQFGFGQQIASRYTRLYKACAARYKQLRDGERQDISELMTQPLPQIAEAMAGITDATTLRQAYLDLGVIDAPAGYDAERRTANLLAHRNEAGRPPKDEASVGQDDHWQEARKLAVHAAVRLATDAATYVEGGQLGFLERGEREQLLAALRRAAAAVEDSLRQQ